MRRYADELGHVPQTAALAQATPGAEALQEFTGLLAGVPLVAVGSGGTSAIAELAALMHRSHARQPASASTPLAFIESPPSPFGTLVMIVSARAKHPDTALAARHAIAGGLDVILLTERALDDLPAELSHPRVHVLTVPAGQHQDGFLATNSIVRMAIVLARLYGVPVPAFEAAEAAPALRERLIVLHGTDGLPAARDIETRMHELGLATVQVTDYRNLAHGRHVGLSRNAKSTTIVALTTASSRDLAEKTLAAIPKSVDVVRLDSGFSGGTGAIDLLRQVLPLPNVLAALAELDPAKPIVPPYGRRLYHLPFLRLFPSVAQDPVEVKLRAAGADPAKDQAGEFYSKAYSSWRKQISQTKFTTVILDYDGTCVETGARWSLPTGSVQHSLLRLLEEGVRVVFASGRGDSLYRDLRKWVPESVSDRVLLGLHNGAWMQELADDLRAPTETHPAVARAGRALLSLEEIRLAAVRCGWTQVSVVPVTVAMSMRSLRELVEVTIPEEVRPQLRIMSSAHSVDIVPVEFGKAAVLRAVEDESGMTLAIGDQGGVGGNDYDLLHLTTRSVTVDVTSPDPTRCWPISLSSTKGPSALTHLLDSFELREGGFRFAPPRLKDARVR